MIEFLSYEFGRRALMAGLVVGLGCAVLAFFVVLRRMAFVGVGISHAALGGVAIGLLLGLDPVLSALVFSVGVAWLIGSIGGRGQLTEETAIGIFFPTAMALGVALMSGTPDYRQSMLSYLFGNILLVQQKDLLLAAILVGLTLVIVLVLFKELLFVSVDEETARAAGLPATLLRYLLLTLLAVTIVSAIKVVGIVLVSAFLVIPAATAQVVAPSMRAMLAMSVASALASVLGGLWLAWVLDLPSGAAIVLTGAALFLAALAGRRIVGRA
ncbi:MAG TPA: metal ABC transporter permease [Longimicrobiales bacterium]|nr:metal ABC transporter permease [Longimicrobiales bacterium]